jgi:hypothetical protein
MSIIHAGEINVLQALIKKRPLDFQTVTCWQNLLPHIISLTFYFLAKMGKYDFLCESHQLTQERLAEQHYTALPIHSTPQVLLPALCGAGTVSCPMSPFPWCTQKCTLQSNHIPKYSYQAISSRALRALGWCS